MSISKLLYSFILIYFKIPLINDWYCIFKGEKLKMKNKFFFIFSIICFLIVGEISLMNIPAKAQIDVEISTDDYLKLYDTDNDGLSDWDEIYKYNTNFKNSDSDHDDTGDWDEICLFHTDPNSKTIWTGDLIEAMIIFHENSEFKLPQSVIIREYRRLKGVLARIPSSLYEYLETSGLVLSIEIDDFEIIPIDDYVDWRIEQTNAEEVWGGSSGANDVKPGNPSGEKVKIAVVDTGFQSSGLRLTNYIGGYDFVDDDTDPFTGVTDGWHGTRCANIIGEIDDGQSGIGITPEVNIYLIRADTTSQKVEGIDWAISQGVKVISFSFIYEGTSYSTTFKIATERAVAAGLSITCGVGNDGADYIHYPAKHDSVIAVGGTTSNGGRWDNIWGESNYGTGLELMAPASWDDIFWGTSWSGPRVAGVVALMLSVCPTLGPYEIRDILRNTAQDKGTTGYDLEYGYGIVDAAAAVAEIYNRYNGNYIANKNFKNEMIGSTPQGFINYGGWSTYQVVSDSYHNRVLRCRSSQTAQFRFTETWNVDEGNVEFWAYIPSGDPGTRSFEARTSGYNQLWKVQFRSDGKIYLLSSTTINSGVSFPTNKWFHIRVEFKKNDYIKAYLNEDYIVQNNCPNNNLEYLRFVHYDYIGQSYETKLDAISYDWSETDYSLEDNFCIESDTSGNLAAVYNFALDPIGSTPSGFTKDGLEDEFKIVSSSFEHNNVLKFKTSAVSQFRITNSWNIGPYAHTEFWMYAPDNNVLRSFEGRKSDFSHLWKVQFWEDGYIHVQADSSINTYQKYPLNQWFHVHVYWSEYSNSVKVWINQNDGVIPDTDPLETTMSSNDNLAYLRFVHYSTSSGYTLLDGIGYDWDAEYNTGDNWKTQNLVANWEFNNDASDSAGSNHGTVIGATLTTDRFGNPDSAYYFNGNDYINLPNNVGYTSEVSAFAWFKRLGTPTGGYHIIFGDQYLEISIPESTGQIRTGIYTTSRYVNNHGSGLTDGNWHHVGITFDGLTKRSYIDGVLVGSDSGIVGSLKYSFTNRRIGQFGTYNYYANGKIDDVKIYDYALSSQEINQLFVDEKCVESQNLVSYWKFDGDAKDSEGINNGNVNGATLTTDRFGNPNSAYYFDGNDYIDIPSYLYIDSSVLGITVSSWVNLEPSQANYDRIFSFGTTTSNYHYPDIAVATDGSLKFRNDYLATSWRDTGTNIVLGNWTHIVFSFSELGLVKAYVNGGLVYSATYSSASFSNLYLTIGNRGDFNGEAITGKIDDVKFYNSVLTDAEINQLYQS